MENYLDILIGTATSLLFLVIVFRPMEWLFPAKKEQPLLRKHWALDLSYFLGQYLLWGILILWLLQHFGVFVQEIVPESFRNTIASQPIWLQAVEMLFLSDFLIYWGHRLQHKVEFLWQFHKVHHTAEHMDWLAAHREHPLDTIYTMGLINLPAFVMGFPLELIAGIIAFRGIWAIYIHSNVRFPIGPLKWIIGSPELHHWHHDLERDRGNYGNVSPIMDLLFGTHTCPDHEPDQFGIKEQFPKTYVGQLIDPMIPNVFKSRKQKTPPEQTEGAKN